MTLLGDLDVGSRDWDRGSLVLFACTERTDYEAEYGCGYGVAFLDDKASCS